MSRNDTTAEFSAKQIRALTSLITGHSLTEAASESGVALRTIMRWWNLPAFKAAYHDGIRQSYASAIAKLQAKSPQAADKLINLLEADTLPRDAATRLRVIKVFFDVLLAADTLGDVLRRIEVLEQLAYEQSSKQASRSA